MTEIYILGAARTPMGSFQGSLAGVSATDLGAVALRAALERSKLQAADIDEVLMGCVLPAALRQAPARQAMLKAGFPHSTGATTVNKVCGSGMKSLMLAADLIKAGSSHIIAAGGMESMTNAPYLLEKARAGLRMGHGEIKDHMFLDGLEDAQTARAMGSFAQETANARGITREQMDDFARSSLLRAQTAQRDGLFKAEIAAVEVTSRQGTVLVDQDEQPLSARPDKISSLRPAFAKDGTLTAANSSSISDRASALIVASAQAAQIARSHPLARLVAHATHSQAPSEFTLAPVGALRKVLERAAWSVKDVDLFEVNEAFAMVAMLPMMDLGIPHDQLNIHGGACALGHPLGSSGSRIVVTLIHALQSRQLKRGVAALCIGGGEATAVAIELI
ncbi:MAG: acetyl-CoA C-acyltransferase [Pseudomonadales bacterium]|nr:acetyl-CoA C-acyltransferase [Pseudomonadales bacterium]